jgi:hypothetical protein
MPAIPAPTTITDPTVLSLFITFILSTQSATTNRAGV